MKPVELYDILTLEDDKSYTIANMLEHENKTYLYLIEVNEEEDLIEENQLIVQRVIKNGEDSVMKIEDEEEYKTIAKLFFKLFKTELDASEKED